MSRINEIKLRYTRFAEDKPVAFNYRQATDDIFYLLAEIERLRKELSQLAIESLEREKALAKLEAEVQQAVYFLAQEDNNE